MYSTHIYPLFNHCCNNVVSGILTPYTECNDFLTPTIDTMEKIPIFNFKLSVVTYCIINNIWYSNPNDIGNFEYTTLTDPIAVYYDKFLVEPQCSNPTILFNVSISKDGGLFTTTLP